MIRQSEHVFVFLSFDVVGHRCIGECWEDPGRYILAGTKYWRNPFSTPTMTMLKKLSIFVPKPALQCQEGQITLPTTNAPGVHYKGTRTKNGPPAYSLAKIMVLNVTRCGFKPGFAAAGAERDVQIWKPKTAVKEKNGAKCPLFWQLP